MKSNREVIDGAINQIPLTSADLGTLAVAEFSIYFQDLPAFEPRKPGHRPVLDAHVGSWVEEKDEHFGYALLWKTRPQDKVADLFQVDGTLVKVTRDPDDLKIVSPAKQFKVFSNVSTPVMGERLSHDFDDDELKLIQHIVRKNQRYKRNTEVPVDKFVIAALIQNAGQLYPKRRTRRRN